MTDLEKEAIVIMEGILGEIKAAYAKTTGEIITRLRDEGLDTKAFMPNIAINAIGPEMFCIELGLRAITFQVN